MPMYDYACHACGNKQPEYMKMCSAKDAPGIRCAACGDSPMVRVPSLVHTDLKEFSTPIIMQSIGCTDMGQIREMQKAGVSISDDPRDENFGVPIAHSRHEKLKALKVAGFQEAN